MQFGEGGRAVASCAASQLTVVLEDTGADGRHDAVIQAEQLASIVTHCLAYSLGFSYHTEITQVIAEDGVPHVYGAMPIADGAEELGYGGPRVLPCLTEHCIWLDLTSFSGLQ